MAPRVLIVDDVPANVKLLEARLQAEGFDTLTASNGIDALRLCQHRRIDVVLLDVMMPGPDGFEVCHRLKSSEATKDIAVVMVTALDQPSSRRKGVQAGADDFLTKPVDEIALLTRVKNLARAKSLEDELRFRLKTSETLGFHIEWPGAEEMSGRNGRVMLVDHVKPDPDRLLNSMATEHTVFLERDITRAFPRLCEEDFDLAVVNLNLSKHDGLRLCSQLRLHDATRHLPILMLLDQGDDDRLLKGLELGINDYLRYPVDDSELLVRVRSQVRAKRQTDYLRHRMLDAVPSELIDPKLRLWSAAFLETHLGRLIAEADRYDEPLSLVMVGIDHAPARPESWAWQAALAQLGRAVIRSVRPVDLVCAWRNSRLAVVLRQTSQQQARGIANRLRTELSQLEFHALDEVSISCGVASFRPHLGTAESLLARVEQASTEGCPDAA